jgi:hypothetical protein
MYYGEMTLTFADDIVIAEFDHVVITYIECSKHEE